jgi:hypothetical protein
VFDVMSDNYGDWVLNNDPNFDILDLNHNKKPERAPHEVEKPNPFFFALYNRLPNPGLGRSAASHANP